MIKLDVEVENSSVSSVTYYVYSESGIQLNLSVCNTTVTVDIPITNTSNLNLALAEELSSEGIDVFNSSDSFFNDICYSYTSENGTDVTLNSRREDYYQENNFCEDGCEYNGINYTTLRVICNCEADALQGNSISNGDETKENLLNELKHLKISSVANAFVSNIKINLIIAKCYKLFFNFGYNIYHNYGFYIIGGLILISLFFFLLFMKNRLKPLMDFLIKYNEIDRSDIIFGNPPIKKKIMLINSDRKNDDNNNNNKNNNSNEKNENSNKNNSNRFGLKKKNFTYEKYNSIVNNDSDNNIEEVSDFNEDTLKY